MSGEKSMLDLEVFLGVKRGMTRVFDENGVHVPVTVVELIPNFVSQVKTKEKDGYESYQVAFYKKRENLISAPVKGQLAKAGVDSVYSRFEEIKCDDVKQEALGSILGYGKFALSSLVDVTGISKGKGFQGVMKRHNFSGGPAAHGSHFHRRTGSVGNRATPARVFPQKKMPGHLGCEVVTVQNLQVVALNAEKGYMLIKGALPGAKGEIVRVSKAIKS